MEQRKHTPGKVKDIIDVVALYERYNMTKENGFGSAINLAESIADQYLEETDKLQTAVKYSEKVAYETSKTNADLMAENKKLKEILTDVLAMCEYPYKEMNTYKAAQKLLTQITNSHE